MNCHVLLTEESTKYWVTISTFRVWFLVFLFLVDLVEI